MIRWSRQLHARLRFFVRNVVVANAPLILLAGDVRRRLQFGSSFLFVLDYLLLLLPLPQQLWLFQSTPTRPALRHFGPEDFFSWIPGQPSGLQQYHTGANNTRRDHPGPSCPTQNFSTHLLLLRKGDSFRRSTRRTVNLGIGNDATGTQASRLSCRRLVHRLR